jgi:hypothetical protein
MNIQHPSGILRGDFAKGRDGSVELVAGAEIDPDDGL